MTPLCACGLPEQHYTDPGVQSWVNALIRRKGPTVLLTVDLPGGARSFRVSRHYVALHGIVASELPNLGFEEVKEAVQ
jgi:hypothetical protein